jgi:dUTP pyrophosphatase
MISGHSANYTFKLGITRSQFINQLAPSSIISSYPFFHGLFDSLANIKLRDATIPKICISTTPEIYDIFVTTANTLFSEKLPMIKNLITGEITISSKESIEKWRDALYFNANNTASYNYITTKEVQITSLLQASDRSRHTPRQYWRKSYDSVNDTTIHERIPTNSANNVQPKEITNNAISVVKLDETAIVPFYGTKDSVGADVNVIRFIKSVGKVQFYGCGYSLQPPSGMYFELFARSSLPGKGWMLANGTGIIDPDYRGELIVQVVRVDGSDTQITQFPMAIAQLITKPVHKYDYVLVDNHKESITARGTGGFGSTD